MTNASLKDPSLFIPLETENALFLAQRILFCISCCIHVPALFCLIKETPPNQAQIKMNLIFVQIAVIQADIFDSVLFEPVPVAEALLGYCKGLLCRVAPSTVVSGLYVFSIIILGIAILTCIMARHQAMMPVDSRWKLSQRTKRTILVFVPIPFFGPPLAFILYPFDVAESERMMRESPYDLSWVPERGAHLKLPDTQFLHVNNWFSILNLFGTIVVPMCPFWHMFYVLNRETNTSTRTKEMIRQSLKRLFVQLIIPLILLVAPLVIFFTQMETRCFPFIFPVLAMFCIPLHPILHNMVLLFVMPTYRKAIAKGFARLSRRNGTSVTPLTSLNKVDVK